MGNPIPTAPPSVSEIDANMISPPPYNQIDNNIINNDNIESQNIHGPPPSYFEIFGEIRQVESPTGFFAFVGKVFRVILNTVVMTFLLSLFNIVPISMIIIGSLNIGNCTIERYIPIWLICFGLQMVTANLGIVVFNKPKDKHYCDHLTFIISTVIVFFIASILALFFCFMVCCCGCLCFMNTGNRRATN
uniref:MARVEL domain-containing protein n=1 Tax=Parastrongyloides trichosuri TaxID=131310 RepID=A0A0N5A273_PARTI